MSEKLVWKESNLVWGLLLVLALLLGWIFWDGLKEMVKVWGEQEEYSYGYIIPFISLFLIWQKKDQLERMAFQGSWYGFVVAIFGLVLYFLGNLSAIFVIVQYAFLIVLMGTVLAFTGWKGLKIIFVPLLFLAFMIPLPVFFFNTLSSQLQLISSQLGVAVIRLFGISVFLEGNVIDLGEFKLQVVEACSGLRYLFPLMTLGFIAAYFFKGAFWKRAIVFISSIPITVLMNSFRIGVIGIMVDNWGRGMAEGFLHDFEGWAVFMACTAILVAEMWVLSRIGVKKMPLREAFGLEFPAPTPTDAKVRYRAIPKAFVAALVLLVITTVVTATLPERVEMKPARKDFSTFPLAMGDWKGKGERLEQIYIETLKFDDYIIADFTNEQGRSVNFYVAYYASQRKGGAVHSPRSCIPGDGWEITDFTQKQLADVVVGGQPLKVNRAVIQKGSTKELVYYWFQQRDRTVTNEFMVKWYLLVDALLKNRTDGSLVRLTTFISPGEDLAQGDKLLSDFTRVAVSPLKGYLPE